MQNHYHKIMKKTVFLSAALLLACVVQVLGQNKQVSGTVICSNDSIPLFIVSISAEGTTLGAISRENGEYSMMIPDDCNSLVFSYLGMKTKYIELNEQEDVQLNVKMEPENIELAEVTIVYDTLTHLSQCYLTKFYKDPIGKINALVKADGLQPDDLTLHLK
jgi:hypothetical protein